MNRKRKIGIALAFVTLLEYELENKKSKRKCRTKEFNSEREREEHSLVFSLEPKIQNDEYLFRKYCRMDFENYNKLLELVKDRKDKKDTWMRVAITPAEKLSLTLSHLGEGKGPVTMIQHYLYLPIFFQDCLNGDFHLNTGLLNPQFPSS